ncbi:MAG: DsbA family protein [Cytophagales bacterium]|nr:DsbA family protein [Cytophagales bacterium]
MSYITLKPRINVGDHVQGEKDAPIEIIEFGEYFNPYSQKMFKVMSQVIAANRGRIKYTFRNFPDRERHPFADLAARATHAAFLQGKYLAMHQRIFEAMGDVNKDKLMRFAQELGLDMPQFIKNINGQECLNKLITDIETANRCGLVRVPALFIQGERYEGEYYPSDINKVIAGIEV